MSAPFAVVFDLDGVLLDSEQRWNEAKEALVRETGGTWRDEAPHVMMGMSSPEWSAYLMNDLAVPLGQPEINREVVRRMEDGYRAGMFHQDLGMRIDLILAGEPVAERVKAAWIDRQARKGKGPSDHAPVIVDLDEAPDGDIGPVVPAPSAPVTRRGAKKLPQTP